MKTKLLIAFLTAILTIPAFAQSTETSEFVQKRNDFEAMLKSKTNNWYNNSDNEGWCKNCQADIFSVLDAIEIMPEWELVFDWPEIEAFGEDGVIYVQNVNSGKKRYGYLNYIKLKNISVESCWQWFLLYNMRPWYTDYEEVELVLTEEDRTDILKYIEVIPDSLIDNKEELIIGGLSETHYRILKDIQIQPVRVDVNASKRKAEITLYSWNDYGGLTEKKFSITIKDDNTAGVENVDYKTIVEYDSGIIE